MSHAPEADLEVQAVKKWYDLIAVDFQTRYEGGEGGHLANFEDAIYSKFLDVRGKTVLDLGTGGGRHAFQFAPIAREVHGIDISDEMIRIANEKNTFPNLKFQVGDATKLDFPSNYFDVVLSAGMFEYLADPSPFMREIGRVLKPGGRFVFSCHQTQRMPLLRRLEMILIRIVFGRATNCPENAYRLKRAMHSSSWSKARHTPSRLKGQLENFGLHNFQYRAMFFLFASELYFWGVARKSGLACRIAVGLNRILGAFFLTKWTGTSGNMIVSVDKR